MEPRVSKRFMGVVAAASVLVLLVILILFGASATVDVVFVELGTLVGYGLVRRVRDLKWVSRFAALGLLSLPAMLGVVIVSSVVGFHGWVPAHVIFRNLFTGFQSAFVLFILRKWFYQTIDDAEDLKRIRRDSVES